MKSKILSRRLFTYILGTIILALGITLNTKTQLGISPIISVAFVISRLIGFPLGHVTFVYYCFLVLIQLLILRSRFRPYQFLQIASSFLTSFFIGFYDMAIPAAESYPVRILMLVLAIFVTAVGVSLMVGMNYVPNPADGLADCIGQAFGKDLGFGKNILDFTTLCISCALGLIFTGRIFAIGIGTVISMIFTGRAIALLRKPAAKVKAWAMPGNTER